jgi:hypothetical protein
MRHGVSLSMICLLAACSSSSSTNDGGPSAGHIQCGPSLQCSATQDCWLPTPGGGSAVDTSQAMCLPLGTQPDGGTYWSDVECTDRSACASDQLCCNAQYFRGLCVARDQCIASKEPIFCSSSDECVAPQTCVTDKVYPWVKSCQ